MLFMVTAHREHKFLQVATHAFDPCVEGIVNFFKKNFDRFGERNSGDKVLRQRHRILHTWFTGQND